MSDERRARSGAYGFNMLFISHEEPSVPPVQLLSLLYVEFQLTFYNKTETEN